MSGAYQSEVGDAGLAGLGVFVEHEDVPVDELEVGVGLRAHVVGVLAFGDAEVGDDELDDDEVFCVHLCGLGSLFLHVDLCPELDSRQLREVVLGLLHGLRVFVAGEQLVDEFGRSDDLVHGLLFLGLLEEAVRRGVVHVGQLEERRHLGGHALEVELREGEDVHEGVVGERLHVCGELHLVRVEVESEVGERLGERKVRRGGRAWLCGCGSCLPRGPGGSCRA